MTIKQVGLLLGLIAAIHAMALHESTNTTASTATTTNTASTSNICSFNTLVPIPATKEHTYSLKTAGKTKYAFDDFVVADPKNASRNDSFLDWVGKTGNFKDNFPKMLCRVADKSVLETVCKIGKAQIDAVFTQRFGLDIIFLCKVPKKHMVLAIRSPLKVGDLQVSSSGQWSTLAGIHEYKDEADAKKIIQTEGLKIAKELKDSKVDVWSVEKGLAENDKQIQEELAEIFNVELASGFVKNAKTNAPAELLRESTLKILHEDSEFVVGAILGGSNHVKQLCDGVVITDKSNCLLNLNK